jgi:2-C-methyl-D-erythritol 4-phosphate cytidylyltransferase
MGRGSGRKQYLALEGEPIVVRAMRPFLDHPDVSWVVVALPSVDVADPPIPVPGGVRVVEGGAERGASVRNALEAVPDEADIVLIHDAARPLLSRAVLDRVLDAVAPGTGAIAAVPMADTLKRVGEGGVIAETLDRAGLWRAQTPQGFPREMILGAYRRAAAEGVVATDDAALVERYGGRVVVVDGDPRNLKITRPEDLARARALLAAGGT